MYYKFFLLLAVCAWLLLGACEKQTKPTTSHSESKVTSSISNGEKTFKTYCVACHGIAGNMGNNGAHDLSQSALTLEERIAVISTGRNQMTAFKNVLSPSEIQHVAEYIEKLRR